MNFLNQITVTDICDVFLVPVSKGHVRKMINRKCYGISFSESGKIIYRHNGKEFLSDRSHAVFLPQGESYQLLDRENGMFPVINFFCAPDFCQKEIVSIEIPSAEGFLRDYDTLSRLMLFRREESRAKAMAILYDMLGRLAACDSKSRERRLLEPAIAYLEEHVADPELSNLILAQQAHISEAYFRRLFQAVYGLSPGRYIQDIRMRRARELLSGSSPAVSAVAEQCGFSSVYHFSRAFRQYTGCSPTEYHRRYGGMGV